MNRKTITFTFIILLTLQLLVADDALSDSTKTKDNRLSPLLISAGFSLLATQSYNVDMGIRYGNNDYYLRYRRTCGFTVSKELQLRATNFMNEEKTGGFIGLFAGYAQQRKIEDTWFWSHSFGEYEDKFLAGLELGYAPYTGIKFGIDLGYMPGIFNINFSIALN